MSASPYKVGDKVSNAAAFTTPHGCWFMAGTTFTVDLVGSVNTRLRSPDGSVVWLDCHRTFLTGGR